MSQSNFIVNNIYLFTLSLSFTLLTIVSLQAQNVSFDEGVTLIEIPDESNGLNHPALPMDYNEDGITDIMTASEDLLIHEGLGNNEFLIIDDLNATNNPLKTIDFDNDGDLDIIMRRYINIKESDGTYSLLNPSVSGSIIEVADFDEDGLTDLLVHNNQGAPGEKLVIFYNEGSENFNEVIIHSVGAYADVDLGDMDGDGDIDIVVMDELEDSPILIFTNNQTETFEQNRTQHLINTSNNNLYLLDMDEDGDLDIVTNGAFDGLWMIENNDELYVSDEKVYFATQQVLYFNTADLNNDGLSDFVFLGGNNFGIFALINIGDFQFSEPIEIALFERPSFITSPNINYVANNLGLYDYDSDGKTDIVYTDGFSELNKIILYQNTTMTSSVDNPTLSPPAFSIVPNLVQDQFQILVTNGTLDQDQLYTIYSMEGKKVLEGKVEDGFVDVGYLQSGFYSIRISTIITSLTIYKL